MMTDEQLKAVIAGEFTLDVPNFSKWNPDRRHRAYLVLSLHWDDDPRVRCLAPTARLLFLTCLKLRATSTEPIRNLSASYTKARANLNGASVEPLLFKLAKSGLITVECCSLEGGREVIRHDSTTTQSVTITVLEEINTSVATDYLRQIPLEKQQALVTQFGAERVKNAAMDAAEWCRTKGKRGEKKNWGAFLTNWLKREIITENRSTPDASRKTVSNEVFEGLFK